MAPQELIVSACSSEATSSTNPGRAYVPSIQVHDLMSNSTVHAFKTSMSTANCLSHVGSQDGTGGAIFAVQEGKAIVNVWAWQKDQMHLKLHLPEKLSCFSVSPNGCWAAGGSPTGQVYLWELASGLLHASFTAHYRAITSLTFTPDSQMLLSASQDASVHVFLVARLVDEDDSGSIGKPYGTLKDHTLGIRNVAVGKTSGSHGGRCWTTSDDGTVKMWSLHPPFDLLATFSFPPSVVPSTIAVDPSERFFYVASTGGDVFHIPLFKRRAEAGSRGDLEALGGGGQGAPSSKTEGHVISLKVAITSMALSLSTTHLLVGTQRGEIHIHALPSHQHLRTLSSHSSPITHISTLLRPQDMVGSAGQSSMSMSMSKRDEWPIMEIKALERMRAGRVAREVQECTIVLGKKSDQKVKALLPNNSNSTLGSISHSTGGGESNSDRVAELEAENKRLKSNLDKAVKLNEKMWSGIVDLRLADQTTTQE